MRAILWIFALAFVAFALHLTSFVLIPSTRGPTVRVSHAVLGIAEKALGGELRDGIQFREGVSSRFPACQRAGAGNLDRVLVTGVLTRFLPRLFSLCLD